MQQVSRGAQGALAAAVLILTGLIVMAAQAQQQLNPHRINPNVIPPPRQSTITPQALEASIKDLQQRVGKLEQQNADLSRQVARFKTHTHKVPGPMPAGVTSMNDIKNYINNNQGNFGQMLVLTRNPDSPKGGYVQSGPPVMH